MDLLARGIGRALDGKHLRGAFLPFGVGVESARELAAAASQAVVVVDEPDADAGSAVPEVNSSQATKYRNSDRLAVFVQGADELASLEGVFMPVLTESFPGEFLPPLDWDGLAATCLEAVLDAADVPSSARSSVPESARSRLSQALEVASALHESGGSGNLPWNALWWDHVRNALAQLSDTVQRAPAEAEIGEVVNATIFAAFSFPRPKGGRRVGRRDGKRWRDAIVEWWSSTDSVDASLGLLQGRGGPAAMAGRGLAGLDWSGLDASMVNLGSAVAAFVVADRDNPARAGAFEKLLEDDFLNPAGDLASTPLRVERAGGGACSVTDVLGDVAIMPSEYDPELTAVVGQDIVLAAPVVGAADGSVPLEGLTVETAPRAAAFVIAAAKVRAGELQIQGQLRHSVAGGGFSYTARRRSLTVAVDSDHPLHGKVAPNCSAQYVLLPPSCDGVLVAEMTSSGRTKAPAVLAPTRFGEMGKPDEPASTTVESVAQGSDLQVLAFGPAAAAARVNGTRLEPVEGREGLASGSFSPSGSDEVVVGSVSVEFQLETGGSPPLSPLVAAWEGGAHAVGTPPDPVATDLRGRLEATWAARLVAGDDATLRALGHLALASDRRDDVDDLQPVGGSGAILATAGLASDWGGIGNVSVPHEVVDSAEAEAVREAIRALDLPRRLTVRRADETSTALPSMTSWRDLWHGRRDVLTNYLQTYSGLVRLARSSGNHNALLWAAFPFSAAIWETSPAPARCRAVMLGPLHPLRLAWLAGVESTLHDATEKLPLVGLVEGWNVPAVAPHNSNGRMVALPIDNGPEQVFLGWSMLVALDQAAPVSLDVPHEACGMPVPGSASTGLNAGGVTSALRDYRRMNPHVSTLVVDMTTSSRGPRLDDVDDALLREVAEWSRPRSSGLPGGVRVHDSLWREGHPPREGVVGLAREGVGIPITWSRYDPEQAEARPSNVRILQDAGVGVAADEQPGEGQGVLGEVPLRRFSVPDPQLDNNDYGVTRPGLLSGGWRPLSDALDVVERSGVGTTPVVRTNVAGELLVREDAEWVVSGEALLTPAAIAGLLEKNASTARMLWEWRPPFLQAAASGSTGLLERRPYVSVVKVPRWFTADLGALLSTVRDSPDVEATASTMLLELGKRGLGLSSLVAMGETHAIGAVGFYVTMLVLERASDPQLGGADTFVLPVDVCDPFLVALAGGSQRGSDRQRADLLVVQLEDDRLTLSPVEIKVRSTESPVTTLPAPDGPSMGEAVSQLEATTELVAAIVSRCADLGTSADADLAWHGLGALVAAAMGLTPTLADDQRRTTRRLQRLVAGELAVGLGKPLLVHLNNTIPGYAKDPVRVAPSRADARHYCVVASLPHALDEALGGGGGQVTAAVGAALLAAAGSVSVDSEGPPTTTTAGARPSDEVPPAPNDDESNSQHGRSSAEPADGGQDSPPADGNVELAAEPGDVYEAPGQPVGGRGVLGEGVRFDVGRLLDSTGSAEASYWPGNTALNQLNIGVVGDLGTGKTQLMKSLIKNLRSGAATKQQTPVSMLVFDYKRDFQDEQFLTDVGGRLLRPEAIPIDVFGVPGEATQQAVFRRARAFTDVISRVYNGVGPVQTDRLTHTVIEQFQQLGRAPTIAEVANAYREAAGGADSITSIMNTFVLGGVLESDHTQLVPFSSLLEDRVLVVDLYSLGVDQKAKNALVAFFLNMYYEYMQGLRKWPYEQEGETQLRRLNSYLLVDEATNIMQYRFQVLSDLLLQGREFGVGVILASQYLDHFNVSGANYWEPLRTWFIHQVPQVSTKDLGRIGLAGATQEQADRITSLEVHEALYSSLGYAGRFIRGTPYYELRS